MAAAVIAGSAVGVAALPTAQAETAASPTTVFASASAANGIVGSWSVPGGWSRLTSTPQAGVVYTLELTDDTLFVGGYFGYPASGDDSYLTSMRRVDQNWLSVAAAPISSCVPGTVSSSQVTDIELIGDDTVLVVGRFPDAGGVSGTGGIAAASGGQWSALGGGLQVLAPATCSQGGALARDGDSLYVTGPFGSAGSTANTEGVAKWDLATNSWASLGSGFSSVKGAPGYSITQTDDTLYVGGRFNGAGGTSTQNVAQWSKSQSAWGPVMASSWDGSALTGWSSTYTGAMSLTDDSLFIGGLWNTVESVTAPTASNLAAWNARSGGWSGTGFNRMGTSNYVHELVVDDTNQLLYVGGNFAAVNGKASQSFAALDLRLNEWIPIIYGRWGITSFPRDGFASSSANIYAIAPDDSVVYVGGSFQGQEVGTSIGVEANTLVLWTWEPPQGSVDDTYTGTPLPVTGEGFIGVAPSGAVTLDDTVTPTTYTVAGYTVDDSATITLTDLTGVPSGTYEMHVDGVGGEGTIGTLHVNTTSAPSAPQTPAATAGNASATVTWTAPASDGGSAITGYTVTSNPGGLTCTATPPTTTCVVSGLANGTSYTFDVTATNGVGTSAAATSNAVTPANPTPPTPPTPTKPGAPTNVSGTPGDEQVSVTWQAPADPGTYAVTDYQVTASPGGAICLTTAPALTCTVTGLTNGTAYTFTVKALSGAGWGPNSAPSSAVTPQAPRNPTIVITGSRSQGSDKRVYVDGVTTDLVGEVVQARVHLSGEEKYYDGSRRTVNRDGTFTWQRLTNKKVYLYFRHDLTRSNRIVIDPRSR